MPGCGRFASIVLLLRQRFRSLAQVPQPHPKSEASPPASLVRDGSIYNELHDRERTAIWDTGSRHPSPPAQDVVLGAGRDKTSGPVFASNRAGRQNPSPPTQQDVRRAPSSDLHSRDPGQIALVERTHDMTKLRWPPSSSLVARPFLFDYGGTARSGRRAQSLSVPDRLSFHRITRRASFHALTGSMIVDLRLKRRSI